MVANDANRSRAFLLAHTLKRMRTPAFLVICHDGRQVQAMLVLIPVCMQSEAWVQVPSLVARDSSGNKLPMRYDRVLCDVPCSGDGTLRKAPDAWNK